MPSRRTEETDLTLHPVSRRVNNTKNNDASLIAPADVTIAPDSQQILLIQ
jgi:putative SOS response-associated peptidase YedK